MAESHSKVTLDNVSFEHLSITLRGGNEANSEKMVTFCSAVNTPVPWHAMQHWIDLDVPELATELPGRPIGVEVG